MTAVEWLVDKLETEAITDYSFAQANKVITLDVYSFNVLFNQAKEMERQQIMTAFTQGDIFGSDYFDGVNITEENYYNQTYKSK